MHEERIVVREVVEHMIVMGEIMEAVIAVPDIVEAVIIVSDGKPATHVPAAAHMTPGTDTARCAEVPSSGYVAAMPQAGMSASNTAAVMRSRVTSRMCTMTTAVAMLREKGP